VAKPSGIDSSSDESQGGEYESEFLDEVFELGVGLVRLRLKLVPELLYAFGRTVFQHRMLRPT
jgi:hypothetical protein